MIPLPPAAVTWLWRLGFATAIGATAYGLGWMRGAASERDRQTARVEGAIVREARCDQREADTGAQLAAADSAARDRQQRAASAAAAPPAPITRTITREIQTYAPTETDECRAAVGLLREYHGLVRRLRVDPAGAGPGSGGDERPVPDAGPRPGPASPAPRGLAAVRPAD